MRRVTPVVALAWLVASAIVLRYYADTVVPPEYLVRPLIVASLLALVIGVASSFSGRAAPLVASGLTFLALVASLPVLLGVVVVSGAWYVGARRRWLPDMRRPTLVLAGIFLTLSVVSVAPGLVPRPSSVAADEEAGGTPMYLVLLDGYPRSDTLSAWGIDNRPFIDELRQRGFDHYTHARSEHRFTYRTLEALLAGSSEGVPDREAMPGERRAVHRDLRVPAGFVAIQPPIGMVAMSGPSLRVDSVTDFEAHLLAESAVGALFPDWGRRFVVDSLEARIHDSLDLLATTDEQRVFAHIIAPHTPFASGPACWPGCHIFMSEADWLRLSHAEWWRLMEDRLQRLNGDVLEAVDRILVRHPDAVIVLFSDHGARYSSADLDEWYRSFLVARTPGQPQLFGLLPTPDDILVTLRHAYP